MRRFAGICLMVMAAMVCGFSVSQATFPEKPIYLIIPFDAGGGTDVMARTFVPFLEKELGPSARVVVINKPGASGLIGYTEVAKAKPDGYTIGTFNMPGGVTLYIQGSAHYTLDNLDPLGCLVDDTMALNVSKDSPFKNLDEFLKYAAANPEKLSIGFGGVGAAGHLSLLLLQQKPEFAGLRFNIVPFPGGAPARAALLGNHISATLQTLSECVNFITEGQMRSLGVESPQRSPLLPDVPTFEEQGVHMYYGASRGFVAPHGLPAAVRETLAKAIARAAVNPAFLEMAAKQRLELRYMNSQDYLSHLKAQEKELKALWASSPWVK